MEELLSMISDYTKIKFEIEKIGNLKAKMGRYSPTLDYEEYSKYSIEQFLVLYKISMLSKKNIISSETSKILGELYKTKIKIDIKIGKEALKALSDSQTECTETLSELKKESNRLEDLLTKYHLIPDKIELSSVLEAIIKCENYDNVPDNEELKQFVKINSKKGNN